jgi:MYXO-CTERM domain-containing protein
VRQAILAIACLLAAPASAAPIPVVAPTSIDLAPTQTLIAFSIDPNGTPVSAFQLDLSALVAGLTVVSITPEPGINGSGGISGGDWIGGFNAVFGTDQLALFPVGTVLVEGLVGGTPLVLEGTSYFVDDLFNLIPVGPLDVATVVATPEPGASSLVALGLAAIALRRRRRS